MKELVFKKDAITAYAWHAKGDLYDNGKVFYNYLNISIDSSYRSCMIKSFLPTIEGPKDFDVISIELSGLPEDTPKHIDYEEILEFNDDPRTEFETLHIIVGEYNHEISAEFNLQRKTLSIMLNKIGSYKFLTMLYGSMLDFPLTVDYQLEIKLNAAQIDIDSIPLRFWWCNIKEPYFH